MQNVLSVVVTADTTFSQHLDHNQDTTNDGETLTPTLNVVVRTMKDLDSGGTNNS